jgi:hypothetical protein
MKTVKEVCSSLKRFNTQDFKKYRHFGKRKNSIFRNFEFSAQSSNLNICYPYPFSKKMKKISVSLLFLLVLLLVVSLVSGRAMWGVRKKKNEEEESEKTATAETLLNGLSNKIGKETKKQTTNRKEKATPPSFHEFEAAANLFKNNPSAESIPDMLQFYSLFLSKMEEMVVSDQFEEYINQDTIKDILSKVTELNENIDLDGIIDKDSLHDMTYLKAKLLEGLSIAKEFLSEATAAMNNPQKLEEVMEGLPKEFREVIEGLMKGDTSPIRELVQSLPGEVIFCNLFSFNILFNKYSCLSVHSII